MVNIANIPGDVDNCLLFKSNVEYKWVSFMQASKMTKESIIIFFSNPILASI